MQTIDFMRLTALAIKESRTLEQIRRENAAAVTRRAENLLAKVRALKDDARVICERVNKY
jgi:hypothetical protein